jgi:ADP-ribose pyrophosphatase
MVLSGEIVDNCSVAAWGLYKVWLEHGRPVR